MAFLHGVETISLVIGGRQITVVRSAVVMLVGLAPKGDRQKLILVQKDSDLAQFGSSLSGFTIPQALEAIFKQGSGTVVVCNVYDPATHDATVSAESKTVANRKIATTYHPVNAVVITNNDASTTYVKDTDYTIDDFGNVTIINNAIANGAVLKCTYKRLDTTTITASHLNGGISSGVRTGIQLFDECKAQFGFTGKILICPVYGAINAVASNMIAYVNNKRACTIIAAPYGTSIANAVAGRGSSGSINFNTNNKRAYLVYPYVKDYHPNTGAAQISELSAYAAGVICAVDATEGPHTSPSNHEIIGPYGTELVITDDINDSNTDMNLLNANGIASVSMGPGAPYLWGNRNASFPNNTAIDSFLSVIRMSDIIAESIEYFSRQYMDKPINDALIDQILMDVNEFLRTLKGRGWIIDGYCRFDKTKNPNVEMAAGHLIFDYGHLPPPPLERLTYNSFIDIRLFNNVQAA